MKKGSGENFLQRLSHSTNYVRLLQDRRDNFTEILIFEATIAKYPTAMDWMLGSKCDIKKLR